MNYESDYWSARKMADRLAGHAADQADRKPELAAALAATAQVHATLALAAATMATADRSEWDEEEDE
ncbi:hypothetical protein [Nocardiopsis dassonvillei]|uniref:hypothetical protein n=1 Tax=Nocardiopsis dassonvillei TaxID=2014 RepID=UPI00157CCA75|nr:hypothetical protein [Nocardiopsis dassonvillei]